MFCFNKVPYLAGLMASPVNPDHASRLTPSGTPSSILDQIIWFNTSMRIKIIGIGQRLRGDDSAGLEVVRRWKSAQQAPLPDALETAALESPGINLLSHMSGYDVVILVDAVHSGAAPGTLHRLRPDEIEPFLAGADSAHGWGIAETLKLGETLQDGDFPTHIHLLGIEIQSVAPGQDLSPEVRDALPAAVQKLDDLVRRLRK